MKYFLSFHIYFNSHHSSPINNWWLRERHESNFEARSLSGLICLKSWLISFTHPNQSIVQWARVTRSHFVDRGNHRVTCAYRAKLLFIGILPIWHTQELGFYFCNEASKAARNSSLLTGSSNWFGPVRRAFGIL